MFERPPLRSRFQSSAKSRPTGGVNKHTQTPELPSKIVRSKCSFCGYFAGVYFLEAFRQRRHFGVPALSHLAFFCDQNWLECRATANLCYFDSLLDPLWQCHTFHKAPQSVRKLSDTHEQPCDTFQTPPSLSSSCLAHIWRP